VYRHIFELNFEVCWSPLLELIRPLSAGTI
jgi:hypothetical protein